MVKSGDTVIAQCKQWSEVDVSHQQWFPASHCDDEPCVVAICAPNGREVRCLVIVVGGVDGSCFADDFAFSLLLLSVRNDLT